MFYSTNFSIVLRNSFPREEEVSTSVSILSQKPLTPSYFYSTLDDFNPICGNWQEDAQEYLSFILSKLHEEMLAVFKMSEFNSKNTDGGWKQKVKRSTVDVVTENMFNNTMISKIFSGTYRNIVEREGGRRSMTDEPFYALQLPINVQ